MTLWALRAYPHPHVPKRGAPTPGLEWFLNFFGIFHHIYTTNDSGFLFNASMIDSRLSASSATKNQGCLVIPMVPNRVGGGHDYGNGQGNS